MFGQLCLLFIRLLSKKCLEIVIILIFFLPEVVFLGRLGLIMSGIKKHDFLNDLYNCWTEKKLPSCG